MGSLTFIEIDELLPHEEIIPSLLDSVVSELRVAGMLIHPVVVSSQHHVVLDGNHRVEALRRIGARRVLAYQIDYYSDEVAVKRWFRVVSGNVEVEELLERVAGMLNVEIVRTGREESIESLESDVRVIASVLGQNGSAFLLKSASPVPTYRAYAMMAEIDRVLAPFELSYETEDIALARLERKERRIVIASRPIRKEDVIESALKGVRFPPKSSRHVVRGRVLFAMVPLEVLLSEDEGAAESYLRHLGGLRVLTLPPGSTIDRTYEEEVKVIVHGPELRRYYPQHLRDLIG
jgi:ParB-like chromosome segregation protein Spo0J